MSKTLGKEMIINNLGDNKYHKVKEYEDVNQELILDYGYIKGDHVYIFRGDYDPDMEVIDPGIYMDENGKHIFIAPRTKLEEKIFHIDNILYIDAESLLNQVTSNIEDFVLDEDIELLADNAESFMPALKDDDDFLKRVIKLAIIQKQMNLNNYKSKVDSKWGLTNMKSSLTKTTKMTIRYFMQWLEVLGLDFEIVLTDNGTDKIRPLKEPVRIGSADIINNNDDED